MKIQTTILLEGKTATGFQVPAEVVMALESGKRPPVLVTINGYTYRSTIAAYGDQYFLPLSAENRKGAGVKANEQVEVDIELDLEPRTVIIPEDLARALSEQPGALTTFEGLSYTTRKEYARQVETAKAQETRVRRIARIVAKVIAEKSRS